MSRSASCLLTAGVPFVLGQVGCLAVCQGGKPGAHVAVYDADADGGKSYGERGILEALDRAGIEAEAVTELSARALAGYRVLVLPDVHQMGKEADGWEEAVRRFAQRGGGVLFTHDCRGAPVERLFPEVATADQKHVSVYFGGAGLALHPVNLALQPFRSAFGDHWHFRPAQGAKVLARCGRGPLAVAGQVGKGRVLAIGLAIGLNTAANEAPPAGDELRLLLNAVRWLGGQKGWMEKELERGQVRIIAPARINQKQEPLPVRVRLYALKSAKVPKLDVKLELLPVGSPQLRSEKLLILGAELSLHRKKAAVAKVRKQWEDLSGLLKVAERGEHYSVLEAVCLTPVADLPDGAYELHVTVIGAHGQVAEVVQPVRFVGRAIEKEPERVRKMKRARRGSVIKFAFTQGFEKFPEDETTHGPFIRALKQRGITAYDYFPELGQNESIWEDDDFRALRKLCAIAKEEGLKVWATLIPPSSSEAIQRMGRAEMRKYYLRTVRRFAEISQRYPNLVGYTCDDFSHNHGFFTPEFVMQMADVTRAIDPDLAFMPLCYWWGLGEDFFETYRLGIDGVVFHFRCDSHPERYIANYDPTSFQDHAECMRHELREVRRWARRKVVICGVYIGYTAYKPRRPAWGVPWIEGRGLDEATHRAKDATMKLEVAHELADGIRIYGLGINDIAYQSMGRLIAAWRKDGKGWGQSR